jgi:poly(hydroxyalkanoate) depolymerase family esterase
MRNISDTIRRLRANKFAPALGDLAESDRLVELPAFGTNPGQLRGRGYVPSDLPKKAPLVVVLHGCTQSAAAYDRGSGWSHLADGHGFALLFPEQQRTNNPNLCFNWFLSDDTGRDAGEAGSIRQMIEAMVLRHGLDRQRIFVTGLSAGGAMASAMLASYPDVFAGGAIIAGLPFGCARTMPEAFDRMRGHGGPNDDVLRSLLDAASDHAGPWPAISVWHGDADRTVSVSNLDRIVAQWRGVHRLKALPSATTSSNGHSLCIWHDPNGKVLVETHVIAGMGHGLPVDQKAGDGRGIAGPFMIDVGISSTLHIAQFWQLVPACEIDADIHLGLSPLEPFVSGAVEQTAPVPAPRGLATPTLPAASPAKRATGVGKVIEDALRAAGLMT